MLTHRHFQGQVKNFMSMTFQVATTCITLTTSISINYHTHNTSSSVDKYGPDKLSCHVPAVLITSRLID